MSVKIFFLNGSPRRNMNTAELVQRAMDGAREAGADTELIHLYDFCYRGCVNCFACKTKGNLTHGLCDYHDELRPVLEKLLAADAIVIGTPVYFGYPAAQVRAFMERLLFPIHSYVVDEWTGERVKILKRTIPTGLIFSMNYPEYVVRKMGQYTSMSMNGALLRQKMGYNETLYVYDTCQFKDYDRYEVNMFHADEKIRHKEEQIPKDLARAYEMGKHMAEKVQEYAAAEEGSDEGHDPEELRDQGFYEA